MWCLGLRVTNTRTRRAATLGKMVGRGIIVTILMVVASIFFGSANDVFFGSANDVSDAMPRASALCRWMVRSTPLRRVGNKVACNVRRRGAAVLAWAACPPEFARDCCERDADADEKSNSCEHGNNDEHCLRDLSTRVRRAPYNI